MSKFDLLTLPTQNPKLAKGMARGVMTFGLHLLPANLSGFEVCPMRGECTKLCLNTAGRGQMNSVQAARLRKTLFYFNDRPAFMETLCADIQRAIDYAAARGYDAAFRLNATSDIPWHRIAWGDSVSVIDRFPTAQFYDYTKVWNTLLRGDLPSNYHLTFSLAENNAAKARDILAAGFNVAVVCRDKATVARFLASYPALCVDGDETDLRFLDPAGRLVLLYAKGRAKADASGFVRDDISDLVSPIAKAA